ncbi:hypothetical protein IWQ60_009916, partial [Tieghemiomyces parasiticus]
MLSSFPVHPFITHQLDIRFSLPKDARALHEICERADNQGTILVTVRDDSRRVNDEELGNFLSRYGEICAIRAFRENDRQRIVEFYDSRDCLRAHDQCKGAPYNQGTLDMRLLWDQATRSMALNIQDSHNEDRNGRDRHGSRAEEPSYRHRNHEYERNRDDHRGHTHHSYSHTEPYQPTPAANANAIPLPPAPAPVAPPQPTAAATLSTTNGPDPATAISADRLAQAQQAQHILSMLALHSQANGLAPPPGVTPPAPLPLMTQPPVGVMPNHSLLTQAAPAGDPMALIVSILQKVNEEQQQQKP